MINTEMRRLFHALVLHGEVVEQDEASLFCGANIVELLNTQVTVLGCTSRIFFSASSPHIFNPGLAVARFFYLLSGSNLLSDIDFYTKGADRFSDDGIVLSGSSYGYRIFNTKSGVSQFDRVLHLLQKHRNTKRAAISIFGEKDCGRISKDIPCCMSIILSPRGSTLNFTVHMRANNAWTLMAYNIFEFSLLFEFIAQQTGYRLGTYYHLSTSTHFPQSQLPAIRQTIAEKPQEWALPPMPPVAASTRPELVERELRLRSVLTVFFAHRDLHALIEHTRQLIAGLEAYWADFLLTLAVHSLFKNGLSNDARRYAEAFISDSSVLLKFQLHWNSVSF